MPPDLRDWVEPGHLAWFVLDAVSELDLAAFYARYRQDGCGRPAYDPAVMVAVLLYAYCSGIRSARAIERRCVEDVAFRVVAANLRPDHATIARFRVEHEQALAGLFGQVLAMCQRAGLVRAGVIAVDSTKIAANASGQADKTFEELAREVLNEAAEIDAAEDELYGEARGDELPPELSDPRTRRARMRELMANSRPSAGPSSSSAKRCLSGAPSMSARPAGGRRGVRRSSAPSALKRSGASMSLILIRGR